MVSLNQIESGKIKRPARLLIYGTEGIGKSTLAAQSPAPIFIPTESGLDQIDCDSFPLARDYGDVEGALDVLIREKHQYKTVVIDSLDWTEMLISKLIARRHNVNSIEKVGGGYSKGYKYSLTYWHRILDRLKILRSKQMAVILIAHSEIEKFEDPDVGATYDRYSPRLHKYACAVVKEWCDCVLFATREISIRSEDAGFGKERTIATGSDRRVLKCIGTPACVAKNRYSMPAKIPLSWEALYKALSGKSMPKPPAAASTQRLKAVKS